MILLYLAVVLLGLTFVRGGLRKVLQPRPFVIWLRSAGLVRLARPENVQTLGVIEILCGVGLGWRAGAWVASGFLVLVTPVGAVAVKRTGACMCRGVVRSTTSSSLYIRNGFGTAVCVLAGVISGSWIDAWNVLLVVGAVAALALADIWRHRPVEVRPTGGSAPTGQPERELRWADQ